MTPEEIVKQLEEKPDEVSRAVSYSWKFGNRAYKWGYEEGLIGRKYHPYEGSQTSIILFMLGYLDGLGDRRG